MTKKETTAVAAPTQSALTFGETVPDFVKHGSNRGSEDVSAKDMILPRIDVLQDLSPQTKKAKPEHIEGAEPGMMYNTVTGALFPEGVVFVPAVFRKEFVVWKDRKKGGGFAGAFPTELDAVTAISKMENPNDYEAVETHQHFGMVVADTPDGPKCSEAVLSLSRSKLKASRKLNTFVQMSEADRFAQAYKIESFLDSSDRGDFYNIAVARLGWVTPDIYKAGEKLYAIVRSGQADVVRDEVPADSHTAHDAQDL